jgi:hypothetical protein
VGENALIVVWRLGRRPAIGGRPAVVVLVYAATVLLACTRAQALMLPTRVASRAVSAPLLRVSSTHLQKHGVLPEG